MGGLHRRPREQTGWQGMGTSRPSGSRRGPYRLVPIRSAIGAHRGDHKHALSGCAGGDCHPRAAGGELAWRRVDAIPTVVDGSQRALPEAQATPKAAYGGNMRRAIPAPLLRPAGTEAADRPRGWNHHQRRWPIRPRPHARTAPPTEPTGQSGASLQPPAIQRPDPSEAAWFAQCLAHSPSRPPN
jgi:hypothetical protein